MSSKRFDDEGRILSDRNDPERVEERWQAWLEEIETSETAREIAELERLGAMRAAFEAGHRAAIPPDHLVVDVHDPYAWPAVRMLGAAHLWCSFGHHLLSRVVEVESAAGDVEAEVARRREVQTRRDGTEEA